MGEAGWVKLVGISSTLGRLPRCSSHCDGSSAFGCKAQPNPKRFVGEAFEIIWVILFLCFVATVISGERRADSDLAAGLCLPVAWQKMGGCEWRGGRSSRSSALKPPRARHTVVK